MVNQIQSQDSSKFDELYSKVMSELEARSKEYYKKLILGKILEKLRKERDEAWQYYAVKGDLKTAKELVKWYDDLITKIKQANDLTREVKEKLVLLSKFVDFGYDQLLEDYFIFVEH